jgi:hypothetical protein
MGGSYTALSKRAGDPPNLLDRPADQILMVRALTLFGGATVLARYRITAIMATGEHDEGDVAMPAMPRAALVMIEAALVLGGLEAIVDRPAVTFDGDERLDLVPAGHQVVKQARSPSLIVRRIRRPRVQMPDFVSSYLR